MYALDEHTGLWPLARFRLRAEAEMQSASERGETFCLLGLDLDWFMMFNDTFGFAAGDAALGAVATILRTHVWAFDRIRFRELICRYGGGFFLVLLPNTSLQAAQDLAERVRAAAIAFELDYPGFNTPVRAMTLSLGLASYPADGGDWDALLMVVERGVHLAKRQGRDRVCHYEPDGASEAQP